MAELENMKRMDRTELQSVSIRKAGEKYVCQTRYRILADDKSILHEESTVNDMSDKKGQGNKGFKDWTVDEVLAWGDKESGTHAKLKHGKKAFSTVRMLVALALALASLSLAALGVPGWSYVLTPTQSVVLVPGMVPPYNAVERSNSTVYTAGTYAWVTNADWSGKAWFWCVTAGTSDSSAPTFTTTNDTTDGTASWRPVLTRKMVYVVNDDSNNVYLGFGEAARTNKGIRLNSYGGNLEEGWQGEIQGIAEPAKTNRVNVQIVP
jgi:hypothetical protein